MPIPTSLLTSTPGDFDLEVTAGEKAYAKPPHA